MEWMCMCMINLFLVWVIFLRINKKKKKWKWGIYQWLIASSFKFYWLDQTVVTLLHDNSSSGRLVSSLIVKLMDEISIDRLNEHLIDLVYIDYFIISFKWSLIDRFYLQHWLNLEFDWFVGCSVLFGCVGLLIDWLIDYSIQSNSTWGH